MAVAESRTCVLVLGAHRSGTSVTAGLLARAGFALPRTLIPADSWNAEGYFESSVLNAFHERLLRAAGSTWDAYTRLDPEWLDSDVALAMRAECRDLLRSEYGDSSHFVLKDPRICRFVPFWLRVFQEERISPKAVLVLRPPFDVARSLLSRNNLPLGLGGLIWLRHVLDAEFATRQIPRTWAPYSATLDDSRNAMQRLRADLGGACVEPPADAPVDDLIQHGLQHHKGPIDTTRIPSLLVDWIGRTEEALVSLITPGATGEQRAFEVLDAVREAFDHTSAAFGAAEEPRYIERVDATTAQQATAQNAEARAEQMAVERDILDGERLHLTAERDRVQTERDHAQAERDRLQAERTDLAQFLEGAEAGVTALRQELSAAVERYTDEVRALTEALDASRAEAQALRTSLSWKVTEPLRMIYDLIKRR